MADTETRRTDAQRFVTYEPDIDGPTRPEPLYAMAFDPWEPAKAVVRLVFADGTTIDLRPRARGYMTWLRKACGA